MLIGQKISTILLDIQKVSREYNDNGQTTEWSADDFKVIWNSKYAIELQKLGTPTIFHNENLIPKFDGDVLHEDFFGDVNTNATTGDGSTIFAYKDQFITLANNHQELKKGDSYYKAGDIFYVRAGELIPVGETSKANESYTKRTDVICKLVSKYPPVLKSFELSRTFENASSGTTNRYLRFGHSHFDRLHAEGFITLFETTTQSDNSNESVNNNRTTKK